MVNSLGLDSSATPTRDEAVPTGWKLVPVEPTEAMMDAAIAVVEKPCFPQDIYAAMLASAPAPASGGVDAVAVKALEWRADQSDTHYADPDMRFTGYIIARTGQRVTWRPSESDDWREAASLDEAKAAAQADFEFRVGSFLSPAATPVSEAAGGDVREALAFVGELEALAFSKQMSQRPLDYEQVQTIFKAVSAIRAALSQSTSAGRS